MTDSLDSKAQYERQFKIWKFRKNLKSHEWIFVHYRFNKRERCGKESELYVDGVLVPKKKIKKETARHNFPSITERYASSDSTNVSTYASYAYFPKYPVLKHLKDFQSARLWHCALGRFDSKTSLGLTFRTSLIHKVLLSFTPVHS